MNQESFAALDLAQAQHDDLMRSFVDHEAFSGILPAKCDPLRLDTKSSNCDEEEISAILDSWYMFIAFEFEIARYDTPGACEPMSNGYSANVFEPLKRINNSGAPKRFRRRGGTWEAIASRLVYHAIKQSLNRLR